ncbi:Arginase/deacetylase [Hypomontagnella monticulosa]|nr:Arginase/deacetylase [Hypomontagnella monticulosa]
MAFPERSPAQPRYEQSTMNSNDDRELLRSLNKLSLSTSPAGSPTAAATSRLSRSPVANANSRYASPRLSSTSPGARPPSRSPVNRTSSNGLTSQSRSGTPTLLRKTSMNSLHSASGITPSRAPSRRGSSTHLLSPSASKSSLNGSMQLMEEYKEKPAPTAASVASAYMQKELELLHGDSSSHHAETMVILHDSCYGHRYSRPRSTKGDLNSIVERPERIQASVLGVSMAYVRLGERHCDGKYPIHPQLDPTSLPHIPFRIHKTNRTLAIDSPAVTNVHGTKWMEELKIMCDSAETKLALNTNELRRPDMNRGPNAGPPQELHKGDLYLCSESLNAFEGALGAVCDAVDGILSASPYKRAFVAVRPPGHHCSASYPSGFCWVNNVHVGIMHGFMNHGLTHAAIIDFDLHHGDGSQAIAWDHNKRSFAATKNMSAWKRTSIGYFSIHDINSYPCEYGDEEKVRNASVCIDNAHGQSIWNVHLQEWKSDVEFWRLYQSKYSALLDKARCYLRTQTEKYRASGQVPKAVIFLSAGFDASEWESAGMQRHKVNVPTEFYARLTRDVVKLASEEGLSVDGRVISVLEGGYSDRALYSGVLSHLSGLAGYEPILPKDEPSGLGYEMGSRIGSLSRRSTLTENEMKLKVPGFPYDPTWWSTPELDRLDATMTAPLEQPKKPRSFTPGNYSSPTQASSAKALDPLKVRRSVSGLMSQAMISRPPSPPPPDVPWATAAHELSKLLIPSDRQTSSFKFEELNTGAAKAKRERQSLAQDDLTNNDVAAAPAAVPIRKSLRERKPVSYAEIDDPKTRRRTVAGPTVIATEKALARGIPTQNGSGTNGQAGGTTTLAPHELAGGIPRPSTSLSIRPESSMSVRTQASTALNVRRARPAVPAKEGGTRAPRKPKVPSTKPEGPSLPQRKEPSVGPSTEPNKPVADPAADIEKITGGMKKIKINVLTKEKKEARQKAEAEEKTKRENRVGQEVKKMEGSRIPSTSNGGAPVRPIPTQSSQAAQAAYAAMPPPQLPQLNMAHSNGRGHSASTESGSELFSGTHNGAPLRAEVERYSPVNVPTILTPAESDFPSSPPFHATPEVNQHENVFVPYQPNGPPATAVPVSSPIRILEPMTGAPGHQGRIPYSASVPTTPARTGGHAFTPTSSIPFAPRPVHDSRSVSRDNVPVVAQPQHKVEAADRGVWDIPETPQQQHR